MSSTRDATPRLWRYLKPVVDVLLIVASFAIAYWVRYDLQWIRIVEPAYHVRFPVYVPSIALLTTIIVLVFWLEGAYRTERSRLPLDEFYIVFKGTVTGIALMTVIVFYARPFYYSRLIFGYAGVITLLLVWTSRALEKALISRRRRRGLGVTRMLIVGAGEAARTIMRAVVARPDLGYVIVGFVDDDPARSSTDIGRYVALGTTEQLGEVIASQDIDEVVITLPWLSHRKILEIMRQCTRGNVRTRIVPDLFQMTLRNVVVEDLNGVPLLGIAEPKLYDWPTALQRITSRSRRLILIFPFGLSCARPWRWRIRCVARVFLRRSGLGPRGKEFTCIKFRPCASSAEEIREQCGPDEPAARLFKELTTATYRWRTPALRL